MATKAMVTVFLFLSLFGLNTSLYRKHVFVNKDMTWSDAQRYCRNLHNDLSTVSNEELQPLTTKLQKGFFWIGLRKSSLSSTQYTWTGGENATNVMWDNDQPDSIYELCCAVKISTTKVHNADCNWAIPFYCMEVFELILMQQTLTWEEALEDCRQKNNDLAIVNSYEAMKEAYSTSAAVLIEDVWIGLRFIAGRWVWANGEDLQYNGWHSWGELQCPAMNQRCAVLNLYLMVWRPMDCEQRFNFLCIKKQINV